VVAAAEILEALCLPAGAVVDRRVPKKLLLENAAYAAADRRWIQEGVEEVRWFGAIQASNCGVAAYRDGVREYIEVAVVYWKLAAAARTGRLTALLHRAIPYPVFGVSEQGGALRISLCHKRWSEGEAGKVVLEGDLVGCGVRDADWAGDFLGALALSRQPRDSMKSLYNGWMETVEAVQAAERTGRFRLLSVPEAAARRRAALAELARIEKLIAAVRAGAQRESQRSRQAEANLELQRLRAELAAAQAMI
jgi:hypothetical protein